MNQNGHFSTNKEIYDISLMKRYLSDTSNYMRSRRQSICLGNLSNMSERPGSKPRPSRGHCSSYIELTRPLANNCMNLGHFLMDSAHFFINNQFLVTSREELKELLRLYKTRLVATVSYLNEFQKDLLELARVKVGEEAGLPVWPEARAKKRVSLATVKRESPDVLTNDDLSTIAEDSSDLELSHRFSENQSCFDSEMERKLGDEELMAIKKEVETDSIYSKQTDWIVVVPSGEGGVAGSNATENVDCSWADSMSVLHNEEVDISVESAPFSVSSSYFNSRFSSEKQNIAELPDVSSNHDAVNNLNSSLPTNDNPGPVGVSKDQVGGATQEKISISVLDLDLLNAMTATSSELSRSISSLTTDLSSADDPTPRKRTQPRPQPTTPLKNCIVLLNRLGFKRKRSTSSTSSHPSTPNKRPRPDTPFKSPSPSPEPHNPSEPQTPLDDMAALENAFDHSDQSIGNDSYLLNDINRSSDEGDVSEDEEEELKVEAAAEKKQRSAVGGAKVEAWRRDKLLTDRLTESSMEFDDEVKSEDKWMDEGDEDSDVVIVDEVVVDEEEELEKKAGPRARRRREPDDDSSESDASDAKPKAAGRRNIRTLLPDSKLTASTREANLKERLRLQRLEQKQLSMNLEICQSDRLILDATGDSVIEVHPDLAKRLKKHQVQGVKFMWNACYESVDVLTSEPGAGCILAHCMGLGKTFQVVTLVHTLLSHASTRTKHVLVVCPLSTVLNWQNEFNIGLELANSKEEINVFIISDSPKDRFSKISVVKNWKEKTGVIIMGYECYTVLTQPQKNTKTNIGEQSLEIVTSGLVNPGPDLVICDEGHKLKSSNTHCRRALMGIKTLRRIILTGTPLQNNLLEYYFMVQFVKPNLLGTVKEFKNRFENPITNGQYDDSNRYDIQLMKKRSHVLHSILKDTVQRYEVSELQNYLPEKKDYVLFVMLHEVQAVLYEAYIKHFRRYRQAMAHYSLMQCFWTHPKLLHSKDKLVSEKNREKERSEVDTVVIDDVCEEQTKALDLPVGWWKEYVPPDYQHNLDYGPKLKIMLQIVKQAIQMKEKVLIFSTWVPVLDLIEKVLVEQFADWRVGRDFLRMDGSVPPEQRQKLCNMFNRNDSYVNRVFLISHKVGGLGLNLIAANRVILMDVCWNPAIDTQSIFRVYRIGQTKPCYIYRLVSKDTMEEVIYKRSVTKQAISRRVVDEMQINRNYSQVDLQEMFNFVYRPDQERPTPKLPSDSLLANVIQALKKEIFTYHEHESLLVNRPEEELDPEEIKLAWDEFNREKEVAKAQDYVQEIVFPPDYIDVDAIPAQNVLPGPSRTENSATPQNPLPPTLDQSTVSQPTTSHVEKPYEVIEID